ncbi:FIG00929111: hypothetical protein [hydrothermal vent metagenome]|uniref:SSD domain-containing protein n=1 Tax=hydrothermal vent metagenome TaxID=652676 RepID=A0A3B1DGC8_9ZZZZ
MFHRIGQFVSRRWQWMLIIWVVLLVVITKYSPQWEDVVRDGEFAYLPEDSPSRLGEKLFVKAYNRDPLGSSIVVVVRRVSRPEGLVTEQEAGPNKKIKTSDFAFIENRLKPRLERIRLLSDIIPFYSNSISRQTEMFTEIEKELNALPRQSKSALVEDVALWIVEDWHSDFFRVNETDNTDPNTKTSLKTPFYERVLSGLEKANIPWETLSSRLKKRLKPSIEAKESRTRKIWETASLSLFEKRERKPNSIISNIRTAGNKGWAEVLNSKDKKASLVIVELTTEFLEKRNRPIITRIEKLIDPSEGDLRKEKEIPTGLDLAMSGSAAVGCDMRIAAEKSASATELWTVLLVIILLIIIYRAPLLAIIPLITVGISVHIARHAMALLGQHEIIELFSGIKTYVTVVLYGAGVDYCVFLMARYKEELDAGATAEEAVEKSIANVGSALAASAGTTVVGIGMMVFAEFGKFRQAGVAMSLSIPFVLLASITFTPALLRLFGRWAFWPHVYSNNASQSAGWLSPTSFVARLMNRSWFGKTWDKIGQIIYHRPATIWLACIVLMTPFAVVGVMLFNHQTYGLLEELPQYGPNVPGSVTGTRAVQEHYSAGMTGPVSVLIKNDQIDFSKTEGEEAVHKLIKKLKQRMKELHIVDIRGISHPMGISVPEPTNLSRFAMRARKRRVMKRYVSNQRELKTHVTYINVIFDDNPFSRNSIEQFETLKRAVPTLLPEEFAKNTELYFIGPTASIKDLKSVTGRDQIKVDALVIIGVFLILVILLRRVAVSAYLILSVFFSYLVTLGVTITYFSMISPGEFAGLDWKVPMFLFTILIAVGEDYNIYLITRIEEEQRKHGIVKGIVVALSKTGSIISSCGLIMAGTFSSLMAGSLVGMKQLGFALAFGVLLDTFVVRPILVPAYLILLHSGRFGPLGKFLGARVDEQQEKEEASS